MFKKMLLKQMLKPALKELPEGEREKLLKMVDNNPDLFFDIAKETKKLVDGGMDKEQAARQVLMARQDDLKKALGGK